MVQNTTEISCPSCGTVYRIPVDYFQTGMKKTRCSVCGHRFVIERPASNSNYPDLEGENQHTKHQDVTNGYNSGKKALAQDSIDEDAEIFLTGSFVAFDPSEIAIPSADELFNVAGTTQVTGVDEDGVFSTSNAEFSGVDEISQMSRNEPFGIGQSAYAEVEPEQGDTADFDSKKIAFTEEIVLPIEDEMAPKTSTTDQKIADRVPEPPDVGEVPEKRVDEYPQSETEKVATDENEEKQLSDHLREGEDQEFEQLAAALDETSDEQETDSSSDIDIADIGSEEDEHESLEFYEGDSVIESSDSQSQGEISDITAFDDVDLVDVEFGVSEEVSSESAEPDEFSLDESSEAPTGLSSSVEESSAQKDDEEEFSLKEQIEDKYRLELDPFSKSPVKEGDIETEDTSAKELTKLDEENIITVEESPRVESEVVGQVESIKGPVVADEPEKTPKSLPIVDKSTRKKPELRRSRPTIENAIKLEKISGHIYQIGVLVAGLGSYATIVFGRPPWQFDPLWASSLVALGIIGFFTQGLSGLLLAGVFTFFYPLALFSTQMDAVVEGTFSGLFVLGAQILLSIIFMAVYFFTMERKRDRFLPKPGVGFSLMSLLFGLLAITVGSWAHVYTISIPPLEQVLLMGFSIGNISFYSGVSLPVLIQTLLLSVAIATGFTARAMRNRLLVFAYIGVFFGFLVLLLLYAHLVFGDFRIMLPV